MNIKRNNFIEIEGKFNFDYFISHIYIQELEQIKWDQELGQIKWDGGGSNMVIICNHNTIK